MTDYVQEFRTACADKDIEGMLAMVAAYAEVNGFVLDEDIYDHLAGIIHNDGYCPCMGVKHHSTLCFCKGMRTNGICICEMFVKG